MVNRQDERIGWPAENISLLLKACIATDGAYEAWQQWLRRRNIDDINWSELRLLAALANRIQSIDPDSPDKPRLEGIRRFVWTKNQIRLDRSIEVIDILQANHIPVMLLKGMARIATNPSLAACRFVRDIDILVPSNYLVSACDILIANGWRPVNGVLPGLSRAEPFARIFPLANAEKPGEDEFHVDIHRSVIHYGRTGTFDDIFWERCREGNIRGRIVRVPSETDQFLHAIVHATISDPERPVDWVIDAMDAAGKVDWHLLAHEIDRRRAGAAVANTLGYLADAFGLEIPSEIRKLIDRDIRNPLYRLEVAVYWRLPENRIRYGGVYRKLAEWTRSRRCLYEPRKTRHTLWEGRYISNNHDIPGQEITAPVIDIDTGTSATIIENCIFDIHVPEHIIQDMQFDVLINNTWYDRLIIPIAGLKKSKLPGNWRFDIPLNSAVDISVPVSGLRLVLLDEQGKVPREVPYGLKIAVLVNHEIPVAICNIGFEQAFTDSLNWSNSGAG